MRVLLLGAYGKLGRRVAAALLGGNEHQVTLFVRSADKLRSTFSAAQLSTAQATVVEGDVADAVALGQAMKGHNAVINTAGTAAVHDTRPFQALFRAVVEQAQAHLDEPKRVWMLGGCTVLDVPGQPGTTINSLPIFEHLRYRVHDSNLRVLKDSTLEWSFMCPGILHDAKGKPEHARIILEESETLGAVLCGKRSCPKFIIAILALLSLPRFKVSYEQVAQVLVSNLAPTASLSKKRVSLRSVSAGKQHHS